MEQCIPLQGVWLSRVYGQVLENNLLHVLMLLKCEGRNVYQVLWNKVYDDDSAEYANMSEEELYKVLGTSLYKESPYSQGSLGEGMTLVRQAIDGYCKPRYLMDDDANVHTSLCLRENSLWLLQMTILIGEVWKDYRKKLLT